MIGRRCLFGSLLVMACTWAVASARAAEDTGGEAAGATSARQAADPGELEGDTMVRQSQMGLLFFVFVLAIFLGFELISKVPSQLHTPLMSGSNAISGITIVGALLAAGRGDDPITILLGVLAVTFAMINVVGGYLVTDRMLHMFKHKD